MKLRSNKKTILYFSIILASFFAIVLLPGFINFQSASQDQANIAGNNARAQTVTTMSIFGNNFLIALLALTPIDGLLFVGVVLWKTGLVVASYHQPFWALTSIIVWLELGVYSYMTLQAFSLLQIVLKRKTLQTKLWKPILKTIIVTVSVAALVLLFASVLEIALIHHTVYI
jgi:hypothetical protein